MITAFNICTIMNKGPMIEKRQNLYKTNSSTPPWKDAYRKRCQERLKKSREKFLDRSRGCMELCGDSTNGVTNSVVEDLMQEEWKILRHEQQGLPNGQPASVQPQEDEYLSIFEEIRAELIREEQQILLEYEAGLIHEHATMVSGLQGPDVVCPLCQKNPLHIKHGVVFCSCGVRIETEQDCISLSDIRCNLEEAPKHHDTSCPGHPRYNVVNDFAFRNMLMTCSLCDFMHIII